VKHDLTLSAKRAVAPLDLGLGAGPSDAVDDPSPEIRLGMIIAVLFFVGLLGWAALAPMDAAAYAEGRISISGQRQSVQHREGGVVGALLVRDGQEVGKNQVLLQLAAAETVAQERALTSQYIGLLAQRARLKAEQFGRDEIEVPAEFATLAHRYREEADRAMELEYAQLRTRAALIAAQRGAIQQRGAQLDREADGYRSQAAAAREQRRLLDEELRGLREVAEKGYVSRNRIRALQRARAELTGQQGSYQATIARSREARSEATLRAVELDRARQDSVAAELREVDLALRDVYPRLTAARDQLDRTAIRAPEAGRVVGLSVFTVGGVVAPGQTLMDIVPRGADLVVEARLSPQDVDDVFVGKEARIRLSGLHERSIPILEGRIIRVSADSFVDERSGQAYFTAEIEIPREQLEVVRGVRGDDFVLHPGMPVEVLIPLRKRTALQYVLEPLFSGLWGSFREQ
jgi:HlyD family type I secretion membrane fusion protein